jgi:hypothetical protein
MNPKYNPRKNKKLSYFLDVIICIICLWILPNYLLTSHPVWSFIISLIIGAIISEIVGAKWRPWNSIK